MNMNGEIPSIPIITLAGVSSLTNLLPELPLPTPHPHTVNKSLLYRPRLAAEAQQLLQSRNDALVNQLVNALRLTSSDHVEPCENLSSGIIDGEGPDLLKAILTTDPDIFKSGSVYRNSGYGFMPHAEMYSNQKSLVQDYQQMLPNGAVMQYTNQPAFVHSQASAPLAPAQGYASSFMMNGINSSLPPPHQPTDVGPSSSIGLSHQFSSAPVSRAMMFGVNMEQDFGSIALGTSGVKQEDFAMVSGGINQMPGKALIDCSPAQASSAPASASEPPLLGVLPSPHYDPYAHAVKPDTVGQHRMSQAHFPDPTAARVMLEPLNLEDLEKPFMSKRAIPKKPEVPTLIPTIPLTRIDEIDHKKHKQRDGFAHYNVVQTTSDSHKLTLKLSKSKNEERKGTKRVRSDDEEFTDAAMAKTEEEEYGEFATSLTERVKRRRQQVSYREDDSDEDAGGNYLTGQRGVTTEASFPPQRRELNRHDDDSQSSSSYNEAMKKRKKERKQRKYMEMSGTVEELMETPTFKRFYLALDAILDAADDMNITGLRDDEDDNGIGTDVEFVISKNLVIDLCSEAAKLKSMGMMNQVPYEKLIKVLTVLQYSIQDGCQIVPVSDPDGESEEEQLLRDLTLRRVLLAVDAALSAMYVMTSVDMPKEVFIEDVIERVVRLTKTQLHNAIYPEFDPVYRIDPNNKSGIQSNMKMKRAKASGTKDKATLTLYNKLTDLMGLIAELIDIQELTDTIILQTSTLAVSPFFVENIRELQLNALKLVTNIFSRYELLRQLILDDILSSLARLPSSKKNLRSYRLNAVDQIQMVTALALQLIQCIVKFPQIEDDHPAIDQQMEDELPTKRKKGEKVDREVIILTSYETAMRTAHNFLAGFLAKCTTKGEEDYRSLFENFLYDLLATVNKPEWPASELILSLLGNLLVKQFSSKSVEMSLRVTSLDYLGIVAARLRKDAVSSRLNEDVILDIISQINDHDELVEITKGKSGENGCQQEISDIQKTEILQKSLLEYLVYGSESDPALLFARQFYVAQWYHDCSIEVDKAAKKLAEARKGDQKRRKKKPDSEDDDDGDGQGGRLTANAATTEMETMRVIQGRAETRKAFLLGHVTSKARNFATFRSSASKLKYENALLVTRYLASNRPFSHSFDIYLSQILKVLNETAVAVRTKALKCLTAVIEADPAILARMDMQNGVHGRFLDHSTSVREAAIELVGKFILIRPELTAQYYDMLSERILDTGISVRKRVIKIFRDICLEQTNFPKIPEMCVKMIRRVSDEEGIQKLVNETFQSMWFTPLGDRDTSRLMTRVMNIIDVVAACRDAGYDWLEQLMENLLKKEEESRERPVESACIQIVNCLVENVLQLEERAAAAVAEGGKGNSSCLVACFSTLFLFCKVRPQLLVPHCIVIQPYLDIKCTGQGDVLLLNNVARILEMAVPLMDHPSESFLAQLEEDMMKLILKHGMMTIQSCVSCLAAIVKDVTHNYKLVHDCFRRFFGFLSSFMSEKYSDPNSPAFQSHRPMLLRSLFTVGLLCKHFDLDSEEFGLKDKEVSSVREKVFRFLFHFLNHSDEEVRHKALTGIGFFVTRNYEFMLGKELRDIYQELLTSTEISEKMRCQVLANLKTYLVEEEVKMMKADAEWRKVHDKEDLKELGDIQSGMASTIIQIYLKQVLESFFHVQAQVRLSALEVIILILRQGLVHPIQCLPYLICMGSDTDNNVRLKADQQLLEIEKKYPGFVQTKVMGGIKMSYRLQELLQQQQQLSSATSGCSGASGSCLLRGVRLEENNFVSLNSYVYSLIRGNRGQRRALLSCALKMFDETAKTPLNELIFMADNFAYFPYQLQDEPLYIIHQIDIIVSVSGSNLIQSFRELFYPGTSEGTAGNTSQDGHPDEDEEDVETLLRLMPDDVAPVQELFLASQGCILLLVLKQHLKDMYSFTDNKIQSYSLTDPKAFEKPVNRKNGAKFNPKQALDLVRHGPLPTELDEDGRKALIQSYLDFKELMLSIDRDENDDDFAPNGPLTQGALALTANATDVDATEFMEGTTVSTSTACPVTGLIGQTPSSSSARGNRFKSTLQKLSSEKRRGRPPGSTSRTKSLKPKHKKKKRRYNPSDSEADSDDGDSDPDWG